MSLQACGSGGTTAGVALGNHMSDYGARVWAYGVCDDPDYFYSYINGILRDLGAPESQSFAFPVILHNRSNFRYMLSPQRRNLVRGKKSL